MALTHPSYDRDTPEIRIEIVRTTELAKREPLLVSGDRGGDQSGPL
jgi:hypothetical protein